LQDGARDVADIGIAEIDSIGFALTNIDTRHLETGAGEFYGQWQANITQPDNSHAGAAGPNLLLQNFGCRLGWCDS
jgi:hypothetical protein